MVVLLVGSVILVFVYEGLDRVRFEGTRQVIKYVDLGLVFFFVAEWAWRVNKSRPHRMRYALRNSWELLGMVPIIVPLPTFLRALRLVRLIRILRVFKVIGNRIGIWQRLATESHIHKVALASGVITVGGATLVWLLERDVNPDLVSLGESIWWAIVTVTTVGYGDITPVTTTGRFVAATLMATGIGTVALLASSLASVLVKDDQAEDQEADMGDEDIEAEAFVDTLERLARLREADHLTAEEYALAKRRLLALEDA